MVVFKMRDSVPSARYSPVCNVLRQWKTSLIPTYRVYRLYDNYMKSVEEYYYTVYTHCNILVDMYLDKHVTTPGCQFYVDLYPPLHYLFLRYVCYV